MNVKIMLDPAFTSHLEHNKQRPKVNKFAGGFYPSKRPGGAGTSISKDQSGNPNDTSNSDIRTLNMCGNISNYLN